MSDQEEIDKKRVLIPAEETGMSNLAIPVEHIKNVYICEGISAKEIAARFYLSEAQIQKIIDDNKLEELRAAHIKNGLAKLQNEQVSQAEKLMTLENQFKRMRIIQLEKILGDYMAYYSKHGHFYKVNPMTGEILKGTDGIPIQIRLPSVTKEINDLKESVSLSEGLKNLLGQIDAIINKPKDVEKLDADVIDVTSMGNIFSSRKKDED